MSHGECLGADRWTLLDQREIDLPPWAVVAITCLACLGFLYIFGDRALALTLGAITVGVSAAVVLVWRGLFNRPR